MENNQRKFTANRCFACGCLIPEGYVSCRGCEETTELSDEDKEEIYNQIMEDF